MLFLQDKLNFISGYSKSSISNSFKSSISKLNLPMLKTEYKTLLQCKLQIQLLMIPHDQIWRHGCSRSSKRQGGCRGVTLEAANQSLWLQGDRKFSLQTIINLNRKKKLRKRNELKRAGVYRGLRGKEHRRGVKRKHSERSLWSNLIGHRLSWLSGHL